MTGQLDIFQSSESGPKTDADLSDAPTRRIEAPASPPAAGTATASGSDTPPDDGSLHWMLTGQPEPTRNEAA